MSIRRYLSSRETADKLGVSLDWFYRNRASLEALGFPKPARGFKQHRFDPLAIEAWQNDTLRECAPELVMSAARDTDEIAAWQKRLDARLTPAGHA